MLQHRILPSPKRDRAKARLVENSRDNGGWRTSPSINLTLRMPRRKSRGGRRWRLINARGSFLRDPGPDIRSQSPAGGARLRDNARRITTRGCAASTLPPLFFPTPGTFSSSDLFKSGPRAPARLSQVCAARRCNAICMH